MKNSGTKTNNPENSRISRLQDSIYTALEYYSNVHRGSGHFSVISTCLYEEARKMVLDYLGLDEKYIVIFCSPLRASELAEKLDPGSYQVLSSESTGLAIGLRSVVVKRNKLPKNLILQAGGGTTRLVSPDRIVWADAPDRLEAGTPPIINVIAFARELQLMKADNLKRNFEPDTREIFFSDSDGKKGKELLDELKKSIYGRNILVPVTNEKKEYINLDYAATTPPLKPVADIYMKALSSGPGIRKMVIEETTRIISETLNAPGEKYDSIFTSNTTEAVNIAAAGFGQGDVILTMLEHNSNDLPWRKHRDGSVPRLKIDTDGLIDIHELDRTLDDNKNIKLLAISGASNVLGTCNNLDELAMITHKHGVKLFVDAAQLVAHRKIDMDHSGIDLLVFSGHKAYAPFGTGVLIARKGLLNFSAEKINQIRLSGEENIAGIAALGKSLQLLNKAGMDLIMEEEKKLFKLALSGMSTIEGVKIYGIDNPLSPTFVYRSSVISFSLKKVWPDKLAEALAREGFGIRYGCHCAHILVKNILNVGPSLQKFQFIIAGLFRSVRFPGVARISFGIGTTEDEISSFIRVLQKISREKYVKPDPRFKKEMADFTSAVIQKVYGT